VIETSWVNSFSRPTLAFQVRAGQVRELQAREGF
jgi:hypothetical protein